MKNAITIALAQQNFLVGDLRGNAARIVRVVRRARARDGADLVIFPELSLTGYPPEDLLLRGDFLDGVETLLAGVARDLADDAELIVGAPLRDGGKLFNAAVHLSGGRIAHRYYKNSLPNYEVFDEKRYFDAGNQPCVFNAAGCAVGLTICEDAWQPEPAELARGAGAELLVNLNASPFHTEKQAQRDVVLHARARETGLPMVYVNQVGGQDELVFDGDSRVVDGSGRSCFRAPCFEEGVYCCRLERGGWSCPEPVPAPAAIETIRRALCTGLRDYVVKNGFRGVVVGLSGGIDSAVTLMLAADALGGACVRAVAMPSPYTSHASIEDARLLARSAGAELMEIPITRIFETMLGELQTVFDGRPGGVTEENLQARIRGNLLMSVANKHRLMTLATSNKSEIAVGYATLYGDLIGGYAPLKDVFKTRVYELARHCNRTTERIPARVIERPPTAELAPGQLDADSLPPYSMLDAILEQFIETDASTRELIAQGFDADTVHCVQKMVVASEYKRRQAPPGTKITPRAFGRDRRYPMTSRLDLIVH